jgi:hypothetical protein
MRFIVEPLKEEQQHGQGPKPHAITYCFKCGEDPRACGDPY